MILPTMSLRLLLEAHAHCEAIRRLKPNPIATILPRGSSIAQASFRDCSMSTKEDTGTATLGPFEDPTTGDIVF